MCLGPVMPTSSWWVMAVRRTRGEKNKDGGWEERRGRGKGEGVKGSSGGELCFNSLTLRPSHLGVRKASGADHGLQECELTHGFHSLIYGLFISFQSEQRSLALLPWSPKPIEEDREIPRESIAEEFAGQASGAEWMGRWAGTRVWPQQPALRRLA